MTDSVIIIKETGDTIVIDPATASVTAIAVGAMNAAAESAADAETAQGISEDARDAAVVAQGLAEDARDAAALSAASIEYFKSAYEYGEIVLPVDFPVLPFTLFRGNDGKITHNFDISQYRQNLTATYYVKKSTGLDTNTGLTEELALKTINAALGKIGANTNKNYLIIVCETAQFNYNEWYTLGEFYLRTGSRIYLTTKTATDRIIITSGIDTLTWTATPDTTNVFQATHTATMDKFVDLRTGNLDYNGMPKPYVKKASIAEVDAAPGSYYVNGTTIYVKTRDAIIPDNGQLLGCVGGYNFRQTCDDNTTFVAENVDCFSGNHYAGSVGPLRNMVYVTKNCKFALSHNNGFTESTLGAVYHFNPIAAYNKADGINYAVPGAAANDRRTRIGFEYNCISYQNGYEATTDINNATTAHDGMCTLRINSVGYKTKGPVCADVNGCYSLLYDCHMRDSVGVSGGKAVYSFNNVAKPGDFGKAILINCSGTDSTEGNSVIDPAGDCDVYLQAFRGHVVDNAHIFYI